MEMATVQINIPKAMLTYMEPESDELRLQRNALILYPYIHNLTISNGRAAEILNISKWELIDLYNNMGLPYIDMSEKDFVAEMTAVETALKTMEKTNS